MGKPKKLTVVLEGQPVDEPYTRPSALGIAKFCERSPWLGAKYKEANPATIFGHAVDRDLSVALAGGPDPTIPEAVLLLAWVRQRFPADSEFYVQHPVELRDPNTGKLITKGTPDLLVVVRRLGMIWVVDWKKRAQLFAGYLSMPDQNDQQKAYLVAGGMEFGVDRGQIVLACFDDGKIDPIDGHVHEAADWWTFIAEIQAIRPTDPSGPEPEATKGDHCNRCWQKMHCSAYLLPALGETPVALVPFTEAGKGLSNETALEGLRWLAQANEAIKLAKKAMGQVESQLETFARTHGPIVDGDRQWGPVATTGKRSGLGVKELEELGLGHLIKAGKPGEDFDWRKTSAADK